MTKIFIALLSLIIYLPCNAEFGNKVSKGIMKENVNQELPSALVDVETCTFDLKCPKDTLFCFNVNVSYNLNRLEVLPKGTCDFTTTYTITGPTGTKYRDGSGQNASGLFVVGKSLVTWSVKEKNTAQPKTCATNVTVNPPITKLTVSSSTPLDGAAPNTVYIGYLDAYTVKQLKALAEGGTSPFKYTWEDVSNNSTIPSQDAKTGTATVKPVNLSGQTYTVTATDSKGCTSTSSITINVIYVSAGKKGDKVTVCNKQGKIQELPLNTVQQGIADKRYTLPPCEGGKKQGQVMVAEEITSLPISDVNAFHVQALQNPTATNFTLKIESPDFSKKIVLKVVDRIGRIVELKTVYANRTLTFGRNYIAGLYYVLITQGTEKRILQLEKQ
jgi:hypothetical protein